MVTKNEQERLAFKLAPFDQTRPTMSLPQPEGEALLGRLRALPYFPVASKKAEKVRRAMLKSSAARA